MAARTARLPAVGSGTATGPADHLAERVVVLVLAMPFALAPGLLPQFPLSTLSCGTARRRTPSARATRAVPAGAAWTPAHRGQPRPAGPGERSPASRPPGEGRVLDAADTRWRPRRLPGLPRRPGTPAPGAGLARIRAAHRPHAHRGLTREADPRPEAGNTTNLILIWRPFPVQPALRHGHRAGPSRPVVDRARVLLKGRPSPRGISAAAMLSSPGRIVGSMTSLIRPAATDG